MARSLSCVVVLVLKSTDEVATWKLASTVCLSRVKAIQFSGDFPTGHSSESQTFEAEQHPLKLFFWHL
jgi:hypothetical protein